MADEPSDSEPNYLELAKLYQADFSNRRSLEWQLTLGLWGGLAAFAYAISREDGLNKTISEMSTGHPCLTNCILGVVIILHILVILVIQQAHARNRYLFWWFVEKYEGAKKTRPWEIAKQPGFLDSRLWSWDRIVWVLYHALGTTLLIVLIRALLK